MFCTFFYLPATEFHLDSSPSSIIKGYDYICFQIIIVMVMTYRTPEIFRIDP